ncbi:hypothetical protein J6590_015807, partial [Homalodisca vitripennis]
MEYIIPKEYSSSQIFSSFTAPARSPAEKSYLSLVRKSLYRSPSCTCPEVQGIQYGSAYDYTWNLKQSCYDHKSDKSPQ